MKGWIDLTPEDFELMSSEEIESIPMDIRLELLAKWDKQSKHQPQAEHEEPDWKRIAERDRAIAEFLPILMPKLREFNARRRKVERRKQWINTADWPEISGVQDELESIKADEKAFALESRSLWYSKYPHIDPPSFKPNALRKRLVRANQDKQYKHFAVHTSNSDHSHPALTDPQLISILEEAEEQIGVLLGE